MDIRIEIDGRRAQVRLELHTAARAFASLMPLTLTLRDYGGGVEKIADLPSRLPVTGAPTGYKPESGDLAYYAPWGNLAIFRRGFAYSEGLVRLGRVTQGMDVLDADGVRTARVLQEPR